MSFTGASITSMTIVPVSIVRMMPTPYASVAARLADSIPDMLATRRPGRKLGAHPRDPWQLAAPRKAPPAGVAPAPVAVAAPVEVAAPAPVEVETPAEVPAVITYTDAPADYDGFGTVTVRVIGEIDAPGGRRQVREVRTPEQHATWQRRRYDSGLFFAADSDQWERMRFMLAAPAETPAEVAAEAPAEPAPRPVESAPPADDSHLPEGYTPGAGKRPRRKLPAVIGQIVRDFGDSFRLGAFAAAARKGLVTDGRFAVFCDPAKLTPHYPPSDYNRACYADQTHEMMRDAGKGATPAEVIGHAPAALFNGNGKDKMTFLLLQNEHGVRCVIDAGVYDKAAAAAAPGCALAFSDGVKPVCVLVNGECVGLIMPLEMRTAQMNARKVDLPPGVPAEWDSIDGRRKVTGSHSPGRYLVQTEGRPNPEVISGDELPKRQAYDAAALESQRKRQQREAEAAAAEAERKANCPIEAYIKAEKISPARAQRVRNVLTKDVSWRDRLISVGDLVAEVVANEGATPMHDPQMGYILQLAGGTFITAKKLTKTAIDYASFLAAKRDGTPAPEVTAPPEPPAPLKEVFTTGDVAKICQVAPRTVSKWFDAGKLKGYRVPGSNDRRIPRDCLIAFLADNGITAVIDF